MSNMSNEYRVIVIDEKVKNHETRINKIENSIEGLGKLEAILEAQQEMNKAQQKQLEHQYSQSERTFLAINENLTKLNYSTDRMKEDFNKTQKENENQFNKLKEKINSRIEKSNIDTSDWGVKIFYGAIALIFALITAWTMKTSGFK